MVQAVNWDANRYGSVKHVLKFDSTTGTYSLDEQAHNYTGTNYNFASLPVAGATTTGTTTTGTTTQTTQDQTAEAFGDVKPHYWQDESGKDEANVFQWNEKSSQTEEDTTAKEYSDYANDTHLQAQFPTFEAYQKSLHPIRTGIKSAVEPFKKTWDWAKPLAIKAIEAVTKRSGADQSFRGVAGLYSSEINLMTTYGSTGPTDGNPTGDPRKDDAGFNIVSGAGNYNKLGTNSRRHNMLKVADNLHEKGSKEWRDERDKIRNDFKIEKETGIINNDYNIDSSGSKPSANGGGKGGEGGQSQGGSTSSSMGKEQSPSDAPGSPF